MAGYEFTPFGIVPLGTAVHVADDAPAPAVVHPAPAQGPSSPVAPPRPPTVAPPASAEPLTGKAIAAMARARIREIDKALRNVPALERERDELRALLAAAGAARRVTRARKVQ